MELEKKDCLKALSTTTKSNTKDLATYIASAIAEIFGGIVTCIEEKDPEGFYYLNHDDISSFVRFDDIDYNSWLDNPPTGVCIDVSSYQKGSKFVAQCIVTTPKEEYTSCFTGDTKEDSEFIAILIACLLFKKNSYLSKGMEFIDRMQLILPKKKENNTVRLLDRLINIIRRLGYGRETNRCRRIRT